MAQNDDRGQEGRHSYKDVTMAYRNSRGVSLFESLICLSVLGIVVSLAVPAFGGMLQRNRQQVAIQQLRETVSFARAAAISRKSSISICHAPEGTCEASNRWSASTRVFQDLDRDGLQSAQETTLLISEQLPRDFHWHWNNFRAQPHLTFLNNGTTDALNGSFILCQGNVPRARLVLNKAGRIETADLREHDRCA
ncbi:hypothetical protein NS376_01870 [Pseudomonas oryzihabitans]|nr:hypothetical protein NS376_01870 [Pseudomonas psychrotolerans]